MLKHSLKKTAIFFSAATLAVTLAACAPQAEEVSPFASDTNTGIATLPPSTEAQEEEHLIGDENGPYEEQPEPDEVLEVDEIIEGDGYYDQPQFGTGAIIMGMSPDDIPVPESVKKAFPDDYNTLSESLLRFIYKGFANKTLQQSKFDEVDTPLIILDYYKNDMTKDALKGLEKHLYDHTQLQYAWALVPFMSNNGYFVVDDEPYKIKKGEPFIGEIEEIEIENRVQVTGETQLAIASYSILVFVPVEETNKLAVQQYSITLGLEPRDKEDGWLVAGWNITQFPRVFTVD